jgi:peptidoglycan/xylan/chitin deacetylase (PgdA/CDA1 family)
LKGIFTISLDFELHWGGFEKWSLDKNHSGGIDYQQYFRNTREVIPQMLELFQQYEIHVTWATVGMLFHRSKDELMRNAPSLKPGYAVKELSAYHYMAHHGIGNDEHTDPFHFAPSLIEKIIATPYQELGTHTFAHFYCNEAGQTAEEFRQDLQAAQRVSLAYGRRLKSLVFPRNQFNDQYLKVCFEEGVTSVRSNPLDWFWHIKSTEKESLWKRLNRGLDAYFSIGKKNTYRIDALSVRPGFPVCIPASRLLRPYNPKEFILNSFKISRIKSEMTKAARDGEVYHLWWHPHNFGLYPQQSMNALKDILEHYAVCRETWNMQALNMGELATLVSDGK